MKKLRILFPRVEAGYGHIVTLSALEEAFKKKYGDKFEIIDCNYFVDSGYTKLTKLGDKLVERVRRYGRHPKIGFFENIMCEFWGTRLSMFSIMELLVPGATRYGKKYMIKLNPDVLVSTHWATTYYAEKLKKEKPYTISYCPDAMMNKLFQYKADLSLISMKCGYDAAIKKRKYNEDNLKLVPFLIRNQVYSIPLDKKQNRRNLNLPEDKFTITLAEGGYGLGKMKKIVELLLKEDLPLTIIPICGKNPELLEYLKKLPKASSITYLPLGFTDKILEYEAASDLFCGKSGNMIAEPTFFGVPSIITNFNTTIELKIGKHYIDYVKCAIKEFDPERVVKLIKDFYYNPELLKPYQDAAINNHENYGADKVADLIYEEICKKFNLSK